MTLVKLERQDYDQVIALWNKSALSKEVLYKAMEEDTFIEKFIVNVEGIKKVNYIFKEDERIIGFSNGCYKENEKVGYITYVLVDKECRRKGIGTQLLKKLEEEMIHEGNLIKIDIMFFNPINLEWEVPYTKGHDHPNAPGVDVLSDAYIFFKNRGYRDVATQNTYYRLLEDFEYSKDIDEKAEKLKENELDIVYYDSEKHYGLNELFDDFGNELWRETIISNVNRVGGGDPVLIVEDKGKVCGFTGPLAVQPSKRGYFAGIGIHSAYRGYGAGKVLFSALCKGLKDQGAEYMTLFTGENNPARNIYESAGFKIVRVWQAMRKEIK